MPLRPLGRGGPAFPVVGPGRKKGEHLQQAFALASSTQLRLNSRYDTRWDFTLYGEGSLALP